MNAVSKDIRTLLESSELGLVLGVNLFIGQEPKAPKECVTIFDTGGAPPAMTLDGNAYYYSHCQIRSRSTEYYKAQELLQRIAESLNGRGQEAINGTLYSSITLANEVTHLDYDDAGNPRFFINLSIQRRTI